MEPRSPIFLRDEFKLDTYHDHLKGIVSKFWNFLYYWSDLTEIFTQYVKSKKKHFFVLENISIQGLVFYIYTNIYKYTYI